MKQLLLELFTWWNGQTMGTRFFTWRNGKRVGEDEFGNAYYEGGTTTFGLPRRWVIYKGLAEASCVPPEWHGWLHHTVDTPPNAESYQPREWQKPHMPNLTGTPQAYRPAGSLHKGSHRPQATGDYKAWRPE